MKRVCLIVKSIFALLVAGIMVFSCSMDSPGKEGTLSIQLPGNARSLSEAYINSLRYRIVCSGPGGTETQDARPGEAVSLTLVAGTWTVTVTILDADNKEIGKEAKEATVEAGKNTPIRFLFYIEGDIKDDPNVYFGNNLMLSGELHTVKWSDGDNPVPAFSRYTEANAAKPVSSNLGVTGTVTSNGIFNFSIGIPAEKARIMDVDIIRFLYEIYNGLAVSSTAANGATLNLGYDDHYLSKELVSVNPGTETYETVYYLYVDTNLTLTAPATTAIIGGSSAEDGEETMITAHFSALNLVLKSGWNALYTRATYASTGNAVQITNGNPDHILWVLSSYEDSPVDPVATVTVSFDTNGGSGTIPPQTVNAGSVISQPTDPVRTGYVFKGWYTDTAGTYLWNFTVPVTAHITLYAGWDFGVNPLPVITSVVIDKNHVSVRPGDTVQFNALVTASTGVLENDVTWMLIGNSSSTTYINQNGLLTVSADETSSAFTVTAISKTDISKFGTAIVAVVPEQVFIAVTDIAISNLPSAMTAGTQRSFYATVSPSAATNQIIEWSIAPASIITFSQSSGSTVTVQAIAAGTAVIRATIINGAGQGIDFSKEFTVTVAPADDGGGNAGLIINYNITDAQITNTVNAPITELTLYRIIGKPDTVTLNLMNVSQYSAFFWRVQNTSIPTSWDSSYTLNAWDSAFIPNNEYFVTVEVMKNGIPYSKTVLLTISDKDPGPQACEVCKQDPCLCSGQASLSINFAITDAQIISGSTVITGITLSRSGSGPQTAVLSVQNRNQYDSIYWKVQNTYITGTSNVFTVNAEDLVPGIEYFVTVELMKGGIPYNKTILLTVMN